MIQRRKPIARSAPPPKRRAKPRRVSVLRDQGFLDWLKSEGWCVVCWPGGGPLNGHDALAGIIDPAHGPVNGRGSKGPDNEAILLCRLHHTEQHAIGWPAFEAKYGIDRAKEAAELYARYKMETGTQK